MIARELIEPKSIVVVGASENTGKPGGKVLANILEHNFKGKVYAVNPRAKKVQGVPSYAEVEKLPEVECAILAVPAKLCTDAVKTLSEKKGTKGFIILSAGFSEESEEGAKLEEEIVQTVEKSGGSLIGPNCIGVLTTAYSGVFTSPIPKLDPKGCDFISGSGATAVFIMEAGIPQGLKFSRVFSVGNSAQLGVEEVLEYLDETFEPDKSSRVKLLYIENISKPKKLLAHARSLVRKGCRIAAVKAGSSEAGSRAASSHTGALASSDNAVDALFKKAGIVRCRGRNDVITMASVFQHPPLPGKNIAVITHAGGPAVMLTDALSKGGLEVPPIESPKAKKLLEQLHPGSSVANPIDFLATGTAKQLEHIIESCEKDFDEIDAMVVIFGSPGLSEVYDVYEVLDKKMKTCKKPIYPVLPSVINAEKEIESFISKGRTYFPDEVMLGDALARAATAPFSEEAEEPQIEMDRETIRGVVENAGNGYLEPRGIQSILDAAGINRAGERVAYTVEEAAEAAEILGYPVVMKVVGPIHKSDVGGVAMNVKNEKSLRSEFERLLQIPDTTGVLLQPMMSGIELFAGMKAEKGFGHLVLCGLGGVFVEVLKDVSSALAPFGEEEALSLIRSLRGYKMIEGTRGAEGLDEKLFADILVRLSLLAVIAPEIVELDLNPLLGSPQHVTAVDARMRIEHSGGGT
ncbi:MAG: acetate--CoA ligase family protein [Spirochaetia bacterium]